MAQAILTPRVCSASYIQSSPESVSHGLWVPVTDVAADGDGRTSVLADAECRDETGPGAVVIEHAVGDK